MTNGMDIRQENIVKENNWGKREPRKGPDMVEDEDIYDAVDEDISDAVHTRKDDG
jgi:hypothetical protein